MQASALLLDLRVTGWLPTCFKYSSLRFQGDSRAQESA